MRASLVYLVVVCVVFASAETKGQIKPAKDSQASAPPAPAQSPAPGAGAIPSPDASAGMPVNFHASVPGGMNDPAGSMPMVNDPEDKLDIRKQVEDAPVDPNPPLKPIETPGAKAGEPGGPPMFYMSGAESTKPVELRKPEEAQAAPQAAAVPEHAPAPSAPVAPANALDAAEQHLNEVLNSLGDVSGQISETESKLKGEEDTRAGLLKKKSDLERSIGAQLREDAQQMMEKSERLMAEQKKFNDQSAVDQSYAGAQLREVGGEQVV